MGRTKGTYTLTSNIEPKVGAPLDARTVVKLKTDLTANNTFPYPYKGLTVFVEEENKKYTLIGSDTTDINNWSENDSGSSITINETLLANSWDANNRQSIQFSEYDPNQNGVIGMPTSVTAVQKVAYQDADIRVYSQSGNTLTFEATNVPTIDLPVCLFITDVSSGGGGGCRINLPQCICKRAGYSGSTAFNESMQYLNISTGNAPFSVEAYFYLYDASDGYILTFGSGDSHKLFGMGAGSIVTYGDDWSIPGTHTGLHHRIITYDGNVTFKTYQDGVLIDTHTITSALNITNSNIYWGSWISKQYGICGNVHYAKYYNKVLTANEIELLYENRNSVVNIGQNEWEQVAENALTASWTQDIGTQVIFICYWNEYELWSVFVGLNGIVKSNRLAVSGNIGTSPIFSYSNGTVTATWGSPNYAKIKR